jgi:hypothetical protein
MNFVVTMSMGAMGCIGTVPRLGPTGAAASLEQGRHQRLWILRHNLVGVTQCIALFQELQAAVAKTFGMASALNMVI